MWSFRSGSRSRYRERGNRVRAGRAVRIAADRMGLRCRTPNPPIVPAVPAAPRTVSPCPAAPSAARPAGRPGRARPALARGRPPRQPAADGPGGGCGSRPALSVLVLGASGVGHAVMNGLDAGIEPGRPLPGHEQPPAGRARPELPARRHRRARQALPARSAKYRLGGAPCHCTDTLMLVHLSADQERASVVSLPRDTYTKLPAHTDAGHRQAARGRTREAQRGLRGGRAAS